MSKSFIILICFFLVLLGVFLYIKNVPTTKHTDNKQTHMQTATTISHAAISFLPDPLLVSASKSASLNIAIYSPGLAPKTVQLELGYNPLLLQDITLSPGDFFTNPMVILDTTDSNTGRISYAIENTGAQIDSDGVIARITFFTVNTYVPLQTAITLLPKTVIKNEQGEIIPVATSEATLLIQPIGNADGIASGSGAIRQLFPSVKH